jgi:hypothetical protein
MRQDTSDYKEQIMLSWNEEPTSGRTHAVNLAENSAADVAKRVNADDKRITMLDSRCLS